jgi:putative flippase GtrA
MTSRILLTSIVALAAVTGLAWVLALLLSALGVSAYIVPGIATIGAVLLTFLLSDRVVDPVVKKLR